MSVAVLFEDKVNTHTHTDFPIGAFSITKYAWRQRRNKSKRAKISWATRGLIFYCIYFYKNCRPVIILLNNVNLPNCRRATAAQPKLGKFPWKQIQNSPWWSQTSPARTALCGCSLWRTWSCWTRASWCLLGCLCERSRGGVRSLIPVVAVRRA